MANGSDLYEISDSSILAQKDSAEELRVVRKVLEDMVDYVIRKEEFLTFEIPYDSDYIPHSIEPSPKKDPCVRHCCQKGCVCKSLSQKVVSKHCKKEDCIFHCVCDRRLVYCLRNLPHRKTVKIMFSNSPGRSRKNTRHKRVRIDPQPSVQEFPVIDLSMDDDSQIPTIEITDDEIDENAEDNVNNLRITPTHIDSLLTSEYGRKVANFENEKHLLAFRETFVWCATHGCFVCTCQGKMFDLKNNFLLPNSKTDPANQKASRHHFFNTDDHCTRTVGSVFKYRLRNLTRIFAVKRDFEIKNGVLSSSNSIFKINPTQSLSTVTSRSEVRSTAPDMGTKSAENTSQILRSNGIHDNCEPFLVETNKPISYSSAESRVQLIFHDSSDSSDEEEKDTSSLPKYGLLCLSGYGYLPIKEYSSTKLVFQHPVIKSIFVLKKDQNEANLWLNALLKSFLSSEVQHVEHRWVVVQRGVLKISKPFSVKSLQTDTPPVK